MCGVILAREGASLLLTLRGAMYCSHTLVSVTNSTCTPPGSPSVAMLDESALGLKEPVPARTAAAWFSTVTLDEALAASLHLLSHTSAHSLRISSATTWEPREAAQRESFEGSRL